MPLGWFFCCDQWNKYCYEFQVFRLAMLFQRGPAEEIPRFQLNLDRVTISRRSVDSAICCAQSYVRDHLFTRWDFFTDNRISMLLSAVNVAGSVCEDSVYDPWNRILPEVFDAVVRDLIKAYEVVVVHRKDARDTSERWFGVTSIDSSVGESSGQQGIRISNIVEVGEVEYLPESAPAPQIPSTSYGARSRAKGIRKWSETPAPVVIKRRFEFDDESVVLPKGRGCTLMTPILQLLWKIKMELLPLAEVAVVVVLRQCSNRTLINLHMTLYFCNSILVFRVFS